MATTTALNTSAQIAKQAVTDLIGYCTELETSVRQLHELEAELRTQLRLANQENQELQARLDAIVSAVNGVTSSAELPVPQPPPGDELFELTSQPSSIPPPPVPPPPVNPNGALKRGRVPLAPAPIPPAPELPEVPWPMPATGDWPEAGG